MSRAMAGNLPLPLTRFVGREDEVSDVVELLSSARLLTLTGAGGIGKTRLAIEVARRAANRYPDGVWLVDLSPLSDPALVPQAVAAALGVGELRTRLVSDTLCDALMAKRLLLVLDNCEHLIEACAALAEQLLVSCPPLQILATSREALAVAGEIAWSVPALGLPAKPKDGAWEVKRLARPAEQPLITSLANSDAVRLFVERARATLPGFALSDDNGPAVAEICVRLDGIPLAIELAAARVRVLTLEQIAERLADAFQLPSAVHRSAPPRQQTLRATLDWSYGLLLPAEQRLFECLSVFVGGWALEAAEAIVVGHDLNASEMLPLLSQLVDKSLILAGPTADRAMRYRFLETMRWYAVERLSASGEAEHVSRRHATFFLDFAEQAEKHTRTSTATSAATP